MNLAHQLLARCAENMPDKPAYLWGDGSRTWRTMHERSKRLAAALQELGVGQGDTVAILGHESFEIYEHFYACLQMGAVRVGVNWRYPAPELLHVITDSRASVLLVHAACLAAVRQLEAQLGALDVTLIGYGGEHGLRLDYETLIDQAADIEPRIPRIRADDTAFYSYTSGTTGKAKGVVLTHGGLRSAIYQSAVGRGLMPDDIMYLPAQSSWVAVILNLAGLTNGMTHVILDRTFEVSSFLREVEKLRATVIQLGPTLLYRAIQEYHSRSYDLSALRLIMYGSGPATPKLIRDASETFRCDLLQSYGMTEATGGWVAHLNPADHRRALRGEPELLSSAGRITSSFEAAIVDAEGVRLPPNTVGELWLKGEAVMKGYLNLPEMTVETLRDGWLRTNDIGRIDERGYLYLLDRKNFMIVTGGVNVFPTRVESVLIEHPAIAEVAVVGVPDAEWGEAVTAVAVVDKAFQEPAPAALTLFCARELSKPECPKRYVFIEKMPLTVNGKIQKDLLKRWLADQTGAALLPSSAGT